MLVVETIVQIRREREREGDQSDCARSAAVSQGSAQGDPGAGRRVRLSPHGSTAAPARPFQERLDTLLAENEARHRRDRLRMTRIHDLLCREGFEGSYDAVSALRPALDGSEAQGCG